MLRCAASLWSADLAHLAEEIRRVEPYVDRFHIDVADGQYVDALLFFPDLVKAMRPHTRLPFEVHLITLDPARWVRPFVAAGADSIIFYADTVADPLPLLQTIKALGKQVGISLRIEDPVAVVAPYLDQLDVVTILGTDMGVKGMGMDPSALPKLRELRATIDHLGLAVEIEADGGIRYETVPQIHAAGADLIVPGSLMFNGAPAELQQFLAGL
jgi:ribulose-phosphate 3-epimerase